MDESAKVIACSLTAGDRAQRSARWAALGGYDCERLEDGLRLVFGGDVEAELHELAALERECCAFADWRVSGNAIEVRAPTAEGIAAVHALGF
jgi:hypothetical protein